MSETAPFAVYGFATTHDALVAERTLISADVEHMTIPTPRSLGALCGIALRVPADTAGAAESALIEAGVAWTARAEMLDRIR